jgi:hypothetical protein
LINIDIEDWELEQYELFLVKARSYFLKQMEIGFQPKPKYDRCLKCQYNNLCAFKIDKPSIVTIKPE